MALRLYSGLDRKRHPTAGYTDARADAVAHSNTDSITHRVADTDGVTHRIADADGIAHRITDTDTNTDPNTDPNPNPNPNPNTNTDAHTNSNTDTQPDADADSHSNTDTQPDADTRAPGIQSTVASFVRVRRGPTNGSGQRSRIKLHVHWLFRLRRASIVDRGTLYRWYGSGSFDDRQQYFVHRQQQYRRATAAAQFLLVHGNDPS